MNLLSENDLRHLNSALIKGERVTLERSYRGVYRIFVSTIPASSVWGPVKMLIQLREERGNIITLQNFTNIESLKGALK